MPPLPKKRAAPKVRALRQRLAERNSRVSDLVAAHVHATHDGTLAADAPPEVSSPPFPRLEGLSDVKLQLDSQFVWEEQVATRWTIYATHSGTIAGAAPRGMEVTISGLTISTLSDDAVVRQVSFYDQPALLEQLRVGV